jgi:hypothetical protein
MGPGGRRRARVMSSGNSMWNIRFTGMIREKNPLKIIWNNNNRRFIHFEHVIKPHRKKTGKSITVDGVPLVEECFPL